MDVQLNNGTAVGSSGASAASTRNYSNMKVAYTISERQGRSFWTRVGVGFLNRDGSITVRLDAVPVSGTLQLRDYTPRDAAESDLPPRSSFSLGDSSKHTTADIPF